VKIKICGLFRDEDIEYVNEARPDYSGFVFAPSRRQISPESASHLRKRLAEGIVPAGVFVNAAIESIVSLYHDGVISIAQLHGDEDVYYVTRLKEASATGGKFEPIPVIKTIKYKENLPSEDTESLYHSFCFSSVYPVVNYYLLDSGAGSGKTFDWKLLDTRQFTKPWFLAGGISLENIGEAMALNPYGIDVSSGAETDGVKDRGKILKLTAITKKGSVL